MEKYFNDAIIGNQNILASYTKNGEILRIFYPNRDYKQILDFLHTGLKINDSRLVYLHQDINNVYEQNYEKGTNILQTEIVNTYFNIKIIQKDYVVMKENIIVKKYKFINENTIDLNLNFIVHSGLISSPNNRVSGMCKNDTLMQYNYDYTMCTFSKEKLLSSQINNVKNNIADGQIGDKAYVGMSADSAISYNLGTLKPGNTREFELYIYINDNKNNLDTLEKTIDRIRKIDFKVGIVSKLPPSSSIFLRPRIISNTLCLGSDSHCFNFCSFKSECNSFLNNSTFTGAYIQWKPP